MAVGSQQQNAAQMAFGVLLILLILVALCWTFVSIWRALAAAPTVGAAVGAVTLGGLMTIAGHFIVKHLERRAAVVAQPRDKKIPVYEDIIRLMYGITFGGKGGRKELSGQEMVRSTHDIVEKLTSASQKTPVSSGILRPVHGSWP